MLHRNLQIYSLIIVQNSADVGSIMGSVKSSISGLLAILPAEYVIPGALLLVGMMVSRQKTNAT